MLSGKWLEVLSRSSFGDDRFSEMPLPRRTHPNFSKKGNGRCIPSIIDANFPDFVMQVRKNLTDDTVSFPLKVTAGVV